MTIDDFKRDFYLKFEVSHDDNSLEIVTTAFRRIDNRIVDDISTTINIRKTTDWIINSNSQNAVNSLTWPSLIDKTKRAQLDHFAMRAPIDSFYPLNNGLHPSIEDFYIK